MTMKEKGPTVFTSWIDQLEKAVWDDELIQVGGTFERPEQFTLIDDLEKLIAHFFFVDNISTPQKETIEDIITSSLSRKAMEILVITAAMTA